MHLTKLKRLWILLTALGGACAVTACGGGGEAAPSGLSYASPQVYTVGSAIAALAPTVTGNITSFTVAPALPTGLALNSASGTISGTPTAAAAQATYTITATNSAGSTTFGLIATVNPPAPSALSYPSPQTFALGNAITTLSPTVTGSVGSYGVSPALPAGLTLNTTTGQITGTPTAPAAQATYTVSAQNAGGSTSFALVITVTGVPPSALSYPSPQSYTAGVAIAALVPTVTGLVNTYSVIPALPTGLVLNATTGQITGTPQSATAQTTYTVSATNGAGSTTFGLVIGVGSVALQGWQPVLSISNPNSISVSTPDVAGSPDGDTVVTWIERDPAGTYGIRVRRHDNATGQWLASELAGVLPTGTVSVFGQRVAVSTQKRIAVGEVLNVSNLVKAGFGRYDNGSDNTLTPAWRPTEELSPGSSRADGVSNSVVAISNDGAVAMAAWSQLDTASNRQWLFARAYRYAGCRYPAANPPCSFNPADVGLRPAANIEAAPGGGNALVIAAFGTSNLLAAWYAPNANIANRSSINFSRYDGRLGFESWSVPALVNTPGGGVAILPNHNRPLAANAAGDAALVWAEQGPSGGPTSFYLSRIRASGNWSAPEQVDIPASFGGGPVGSLTPGVNSVAVGVDPAGVVTVAWIQLLASNPTDQMLHVRRCAPGAACGAAVTFPLAAGRVANSPVLATSPNGDVTVVWRANFPEEMFAARYTASSGTWDSSATSLTTGAVLIPSVAADGFNRVTVVWHEQNGGGIQVKRFQ